MPHVSPYIDHIYIGLYLLLYKYVNELDTAYPYVSQDMSNIGAVAQWIRRLTSDQETVGSSPTGVKGFL